jgi:predicted nucleotidyltransferase
MPEALTKLFQSNSTISVALMFGSCAQGTKTFKSDLDFVVLADVPLSSERRIWLKK